LEQRAGEPYPQLRMKLYEAHLAVRHTEMSKAFYLEIVQLSFAYRDPKRDIVFLWIGENRASMLGLWGPDTAYGSQFFQSHLSIAVSLPELLSAGERLNRLKVRTYNFAKTETTEPSVIGWMPSAQLYFRDPDGHLIEFITLLDEDADSEFIGSLSEWQRQTRPQHSALACEAELPGGHYKGRISLLRANPYGQL
jgi:lactoylglutathione lyase